MSRTREVFRFEVMLHLRRASTWLWVAVLGTLAILFMIGLGSDMGSDANAPVSLTLYSFVIGFFGLLVTAALFGDAGNRDAETRMQPLFHTTPLRRHEYLLGRFAGAFVVNALVLLAVPAGLMLGTVMRVAEPIGPFQLESYVRPWLFFLLPGLLVNGAILFSVAAAGGRALTTYLGAVALFGAYAAALLLTTEVLDSGNGTLLDPSGIVAVMELAKGWSPAERNTRQVPLGGDVALNRLIWTAVGLTALAVLYRRFRFAHHEVADRPRARNFAGDGAPPAANGRPASTPTPVRDVPVAQPAWSAATGMRQAGAIASRALRGTLRSREFLLVQLGLVAFVAFGITETLGDEWGTPNWPVTALVASFLAGGIIEILVALLVAFFAGELVWADRDARLADMLDASPVPEWAAAAGRILALFGLIVVLQGTIMAAGMLMQLLLGYARLQPLLHLQILFGLQLPDYLIFGVAAVLIHTLVNQKYVGHLVAVGFYLAARFAPAFGVRHQLFRFGSDPGWVYSDLSGFGPFLPGFVATKLYWGAWALLLAVLVPLLVVRGRELAILRRLRAARARLTGRLALAAAGAVLLVLASGGFVFYNTNVLHAYRDPDEQALPQVEYERRYKHLDDAPQPRIARVQARIELYPEDRRVDVQGLYVLANRTGRPLDSLHVHLRPFYDVRALTLDRSAVPVRADTVHRMWIFRLAQPLAPGDSLQLRFRLAYAPRGFPNAGVATSVVENGTYVERHVMPAIGYQRSYEIEGAVARRRFGLPARAPLPPPTDSAARHEGPSWGEYDVVVGTSADQIAVAPGTLRRSWRENGRRYFQYVSRGPTSTSVSFLSGRFAVRDTVVDGMRVSLLHHPTHTFNTDRLLEAAGRSLRYYSRNFGPNPWSEVRIVEFPRYSRRATAAANLIAHSESFGFLSRVDDAAGDLDTPLLVTAHELAHFWWGGQVIPAAALGGQMLSETLANYSAMMVLEEARGKPAVRRFQRIMHIEYLNRRGHGDVPLLLTSDNPTVHYRKGAIAMYALREYLGEERVNAALRAFLAKHRFSRAPYPTAPDLLAELRAVTPDSLQYLLTDLLETITIWDLRAADVRAEPLGDGRYRVKLRVEAGKFRVDSAGADTRVPLDDLVEIGVFGDGDAPLYLAKHRIHGDTTISVVVRGRPSSAGIDPYAVLVARRGDDLRDNVRDVD